MDLMEAYRERCRQDRLPVLEGDADPRVEATEIDPPERLTSMTPMEELQATDDTNKQRDTPPVNSVSMLDQIAIGYSFGLTFYEFLESC